MECFLNTCVCSMVSGMSGTMLASFYPGVALSKNISITVTGNVFGIRYDFNVVDFNLLVKKRYISMILTALCHSKYLGRSYMPATSLVIGVILSAIG